MFVLAVGQVVAPVLFYASGSDALDSGRPGEAPIVPAGYAFSIWGLIVVLALGYAVWQLRPEQREQRLLDDLAWPLAGVFAGFSIWLVFAAVPTPAAQWATVVVFVAMLGGLLRALQVVLERSELLRRGSRTGRWLTLGTVGTYTGWTAAAVWVNLTTAASGSGAPVSGPAGTAAQLAVLAGATATVNAIAWWTRGLAPFAAAAAWAFVGVAIGATQQGQGVLATAAVAGTVILTAVTAARTRRSAAA